MKEFINFLVRLSVGLFFVSSFAYGQAQSGTQPGKPVFSGRPKVVTIDRILVVVNNEVITENDLKTRVDYVSRQLSAQNVNLPPREILESQLLDRMIVEKLQAQRAKELGVKVTEDHLNDIIKRVINAQRPGMSVADYEAAMTKEGIDFNYFKEDLRKEILLSMVREQEVDSRIKISNEEVDNYLINQQGDQEQELELGQILITLPENADKDTIARKEALVNTIMAQLSQGADFKKVAMQYSEGQNAMEGGAMGWRMMSSLPLLYADAVFEAKDGAVIGPLRSANTIHVLKLYARRTAEVSGERVQQYQVSHILMRPDEATSIDMVVDRLKQLQQTLQADPSKFYEIARQYSKDATSSKGGALGWVSPGEMVPEFEAVMVNLPLNQVSDPVQTPYGWHLILVTDKRVIDAGDSAKRKAAKDALKERKIEEVYQHWLTELRGEAFIEFKHTEDID